VRRLAALLRLLPERDPHARIYAMADALAANRGRGLAPRRRFSLLG